MFDPANVPPVQGDEPLARFITQSSQFRGDGSIKADAFIPAPHVELSVTRLREATSAEVWKVGTDVANSRRRTLYGRCDIRADQCRIGALVVLAVPVAGNPNHADIAGWPPKKEEQKVLALELAAAASKLITPT